MTNFLKIALGNKVPNGVTVDVEDMVDESNSEAFATVWNASPALRYIVDYGWKQTLNDAIAGVKLTDHDYSVANTLAIVTKKIDAILGGTVKAGRVVARAANPVVAEARHIASAMFMKKTAEARRAAIAAVKAANAGFDDTKAKAYIIGLIAATESVVAMAEANVAARAAVPTFDLASLMAAPESDDESDAESEDEAERDEASRNQ